MLSGFQDRVVSLLLLAKLADCDVEDVIAQSALL
jgi:hypothetical protein